MPNKHKECVLGLIPARGGSKGIPRKNLLPLAGKPLIVWTIEAALACSRLDRVIVSTDDHKISEISRSYGAEVPFMRPSEISQDSSTDLEVFTHALKWLAENEGYVPDICVHLRPTYPIREIKDIEAVIQMLLDNPNIDSVRSVTPAKVIPMKMWFRGEDGLLSPVVKTEIKEPYNLPRQLLPKTFVQNACIDAVRTRVITELRSMTGLRIFGYLMDDDFDIDTKEQLKEAEAYLTQDVVDNVAGQCRSLTSDERKAFCFDIDGIIATIVPDSQYDLAGPLRNNIHIINSLYEQGHRIMLFTARGSATGIDWTEVTKKQMKVWGVKYHELLFGKPAADYYIDDKMLSLDELNQTVLRKMLNHGE